MLIIVLILTTLIIIGIVIDHLSCDYNFIGELIAIISVVILAMCLAIWPACYYSTESKIQEYYQAKQTIEDARNKGLNNIENAALEQKIWDTNKWLAGNKYWRKTVFKDVIPKEIDNLEPLK